MTEHQRNWVALTDSTGEWLVRNPELWHKPTFYEITDKEEALKYLGHIALNPKFCDRNAYDEKAVFASEAEALAFAGKHFHFSEVADDRPKKLHIIFINSDGHLTWDKPL